VWGFEMCIRDDNWSFVLAKALWPTLGCSTEEGEAFEIVTCH